MNRKRYYHKMMNLLRLIRDDAVTKGDTLKLGRALKFTRDADLRNGLKEYGSYDGIWNSPNMKHIRNYYGCR